MAFTPPPHLSPSSIGTFKQCPLKFKYNKIDGITDDPTEATLMGNFVHDVLEELYKQEPDFRTQSEAKKIAAYLWANSWEQRVIPWVRGEEKIRLFRWNSWWCIENLWKIENPLELLPTGLEHELNGKIGGVQIKGFIDRFSPFEDSFVISDYKTGKTPKPKWVSDKFFQLLVYAHLLDSLGYGKAKQVELLYLKDGVKYQHKVTEEDLASVEETIVTVKKQIDAKCETEEFEPIKSVLCGWCSYKTICPAWK
jgi:putative RecB family exonuclease